LTSAATAAATVWVVTGVLLVAPWLGADEKRLLVNLLLMVCPMPGVAYCLWAARRTTGRLHSAWLCFAGTSASWVCGNVVWNYYQYVADRQPFPTAADGFYVLALVLAGAGLVVFPTGARGTAVRSRLVLDALSIGSALLLISDVLVLDEVLGAMGSGLGAAVLVTYPVGDVLLASVAVLLLARSPGRPRSDILIIALALLVYATADTAYALLGARGEFAIGSPLDLGWLGGYLLLGLAALTPDALVQERRDLRHAGTNTPGALLLYTVMGAALLLPLLKGVDDPIELALTVAVVGLFALRQVLLTQDNRELNEGLEDVVAVRTTQLDDLSRRHQRILDAVGDGIYGVDQLGRVTFMNPAAGRLLGCDPAELTGRQAHSTFHVEEHRDSRHDHSGAAPDECHVAAAIEGAGTVRRVDDVYRRHDGQPFPVELTATPLRGKDGVAGAVVVFRDMTERRAVERMKEEFVSVVSHELRTPLTAIRGSLGLIAGGAVGALPPQADRMVGIALDNSERLTRLINDILDLERMESGAIPMEMGVHDAADLLNTTVTSIGPVAEAAGVVLRRGAAHGRVHADADRIVQALTNLAGNAVKFTPPGAHVTLSADVEGAHVTFTVQDEGRGIPSDKLDFIFGRFQQVDSSDARERGGTGLGLAITKTIVERHGGQITVDSVVGRGSRFAFTLPAALDPITASTADESEHAPTVLLCDDDPHVLEVLSMLLRERGYATKPAARGRDAVDLAVSGHPDVILLDLRMPGMSGWEAISELKGRPETWDIPIVVMSGLGPEADPDLAARTEGWVRKPVDETQMAQALLAATRGDGRVPSVLVVEDDDDLASVLVALCEREGLHVARAATQSEAIAQVTTLRPDALVLDILLLEGDGYGVVAELRRDGRLGEVPVIVYSAQELDAASRQRLQLGEMVFMTKGQDSPQDLARRLVSVVHSMARRYDVEALMERSGDGVTSRPGG
jgi:PAS domain S-box-containing protein